MEIKETKYLSEIEGLDAVKLNVFFTRKYASLIEASGKSLTYVFSSSFVMPVQLTKHGLFCYATMVTEPYQYHNGEESLKLFLDATCGFLKNEKKVQWVGINPASSFFFDYPSGARHIPFGSHVIDLSLSEEDLWKKMHSKHRNVIKKAEKDGVIVKSGTSQSLLDDYDRINIETWKRSNRAANSKEVFSQMIQKMEGSIVVYISYLDEEPQSGAIFFYNENMCYYIYGANKNNPHIGSGNLLQWKAILNMKSMGVKKYSFVGCRINEDEDSKYHGIQRFKERFGGDLIQSYLFKIDFNPLMRKLFDLIITISPILSGHIRLAPPRDIIDQEIHKWPQ